MNKLYVLCLLAAMLSDIYAAPKRNRDGGTTFDQKQSGEYNIQLHLKDFQIIAVVGDDSFSSFGDYDYNYDYSDLTVKPPSSTSTSTSSSASSTTENQPEIASEEFSSIDSTTANSTTSYTHPYPIISPSTSKKPAKLPPSTIKQEPILSSTTISPVTTPTPVNTTNVQTNGTVALISTTTTTPPTTVTTIKPNLTSTTRTLPTQNAQNHYSNVPGQIPVVVQDFSVLRDDKPVVKDKDNKKIDGVTSVTIVPLDDTASVLNSGDQLTLGEIMHYRRCAQGYQRDKRGRCRKVRRPQIPLGITRFASNLAARFRQPGPANAEISDEANIE